MDGGKSCDTPPRANQVDINSNEQWDKYVANKGADDMGVAITKYGWSDGKKTVSIYIELDGLDDVGEDKLTVESFEKCATFTIASIGGKKRSLVLNRLANEIDGVKIQQKKGKNVVVLKLQKKEEKSWYELLDTSSTGGGGDDNDEEGDSRSWSEAAPSTPPRRKATATTSEEGCDSLLLLSDRMPLLAGKPLQAPRLLQTGWIPGQVFSNVQDDPDRTRHLWNPPAFVFEQDPIARRNAVSVEELDIPRSSPLRFARVLRGVLLANECVDLLASVNEKGFTPALLNIGNDMQQLSPAVRDGHRVIVDSPELTLWLLEIIRPHLPAELENGAQLADLNERCRILCYTPGQEFVEHYDGRYRRPAGHPRAGDFSRVTVQLYLHDVPETFGGATTFFPGEPHSVKHQPEVGSVLLFTQDLLHEGSLVKEGLKYTIRTEVLYSPPSQQLNAGYSLQGAPLLPIPLH